MEDTFKKIESLEEEIKRLKSEIEKKKTEEEGAENPPSPEKEEKIMLKALKEHIEKYPPEKLGDQYRINKQEKEEHIYRLEPEEDDRKIEELLKIADERGLINAFEICRKLNNPHLQDDFHRMLIERWKNKGFK